MPISNPSLPPAPDGLHVDSLTLDTFGLLIIARTMAAQACFRVCGRASAWVHSRYWRTFDDLPWQERSMMWQVQVRRFRCGHCPGRIFAERVPGLGAHKARRGDWLAEAQTEIGMVLGGEAGARLSRRLAMPVSGDTVLRLIRRRGTVPSPQPRVIGINDWAWRRGQSYDTIVCDLERRRVIDLLPGRSSAPVRDWLTAHPSVTVVSRDRSGSYAEAARTGAPTATQVADRWHLLDIASGGLRGNVERHQSEIRDAAHRAVHEPAGSPDLAETVPTNLNSRRRDRCEAALCLHGEGLPTKEIARRLGASRNAVRRWVRAGRFMPNRRAPASSLLDRYLPSVEARWREGQHSATVLHLELRAKGFIGRYDIVRRWASRRRQDAPARSPFARAPSARRITRWLTADPAALSREDRAFTEALCRAAPKLNRAAAGIRAFADLPRKNDPTGLTPWLEAATATDLGGFVTGLRQDEPAVRAAIVEPSGLS